MQMRSPILGYKIFFSLKEKTGLNNKNKLYYFTFTVINLFLYRPKYNSVVRT